MRFTSLFQVYTEEQVIASLIRYIRSEVISKMDSASKFLAGAVLIKNAGRLPDILKQYSSAAKIAGIYNPDGTIDVDSWMIALRQSMQEFCGNNMEINLPVIGKVRISGMTLMFFSVT